MPLRSTVLLLSVLVFCWGAETPSAAPAPATVALPIARVEVTAPDDAARSRDGAVGRIAIGRAAIAAYGDSHLADVLKRQPGVAIVGSEVRMRGLGAGYTRILIDGSPAPQGFTLDSLSPEAIERIEIVRSATAEQSTGAIAGTINLVLRRRASAGQREATMALGHQHGHLAPSASTMVGARSGTLAWSVNAAAERSTLLDVIHTQSLVDGPGGAPLASRRSTFHGKAKVDRLNLAPRLHWNFDGGDTLSWHTLMTATRSAGGNRIDETTLAGSPTRYPDNRARLDVRSSTLRSELAWAGRFHGGKLSTSALVDAQQRRADYLFQGEAVAGPDFARQVDGGADERLVGLKGKYLLPLGAAHSLAVGWDASRTRRDEFRHQRDAFADGSTPPALLQDYSARVRSLAVFAQDEWEIGERTQAYLGLRWEALDTVTDGADIGAVRSRQSVLSPVAQLLWKLPARQQVRLAVARTYKAPLPRDLVPRRFTVNNDNSAVNPDFEGNPALRPELSWGLDGAYERSVGKDGMVSIAGYLRRVTDVTVQRLVRDGASWVTQPVNDGAARVAGIEIDVKGPLTLGTIALDARMNLSRHWSRVARVAGPDNRLADQVPLTANVGVDYRSANGWTGGANLNYQGSGASATSAGVRQERGAQALLDLHWSRTLAGAWQLRLSAVNALGRERTSATTYLDGQGRQRRTIDARGFATLRATLKRSW